uniref:SRCR domain-containing protein n=1 Tax=Erpetoichthys calabaricus TaxID=27687 RepID=A0A8C4TEP6_ERPCA
LYTCKNMVSSFLCHFSVFCTGYTGYRLVNGTDSCSGRVELQFDGKWGTVCDQYWTLKDANVLCHQLNCGYATEAPGQASFGEGIGEIWADIFGCEGSETHLSKCPISVWGRGDCSHANDAGVICSVKDGGVRLLGGQGICEGRVEVFYNRTWSRVIDNSWGDRESSVVCRQLGCGSGIEASTSYLYGNGKGNVCVTGIQCSERNSHLKSCTRPQTAHCGISHDVAVICSDINQIKMRLTEGCSGKLQVFYSGTWGSVCQNQMDPHTATMICRELGCYNLTSLNVGNSEIDGDPKWLDNVRCRPHDSYLRQCPSSPWGKNKCNNDEVAVITCSELRLVGGSNCSGRVEIKYDGSWGTVCDDSWDLKDAQVVCRQLGCGEPASADLEFGGGIGIIWLNKVNCIGLESFLWDCPHALVGLNDCHHKEDAGVTCRDLKLVNGRGPCEGRVEVLHGYSWKSICEANFNQMAAEVVCRELDCGVPKKYQGGMFGQGSGTVWEKKIQCRESEKKIFDCSSPNSAAGRCTKRNDVGLVCVRKLVNGSDSECSGRVELYYDRRWGTVCDRYWDLQDASVLCNQIGCGYAIEAPGQARFGEGKGEIWRDNLHCEGDETDLTKCPALDYGREECTHKNDAGVVCSSEYLFNWFLVTILPSYFCFPDHLDLRLTNGTSVCDGRLEIFYNGSWGTVCDDSWDLPDANVVCRQLQCEAAVEAITPVSYGPGSGHIWLDDVHCQGNESSLSICTHRGWGQNDCRHKEDVGKFKMLRLTDGCSGQLQVFYNNSWGSVCANNMDKATAAKFCQELGCGSLKSDVKEELSKLDLDPKWLDNVRCRGHEASVWQCPSSPWGKNTCTRTENEPLTCFTEALDLRLVEGANNCSGRVEIKYGDTWGTVCDDDWDMKDVKVVCQQLRCGEPMSAELEFGGGRGVIWLNKVRCRGTEAHLWDCQHEPLGKNDCEHKEDAGVNCTALFKNSMMKQGPQQYSLVTAGDLNSLLKTIYHSIRGSAIEHKEHNMWTRDKRK